MYKDNLIVVSPNIVCNRTYIIIIIHYITFSALPFFNCTCFLVITSAENSERKSQNYKYLGSMIQEKKIAAVAAVQCRIGRAAAVLASLKRCLWKKADIATKMRLFWSLIILILLYGSET